MRLQKISVLVAVMALVLALGGCRGKKEKQAEGPQKTEFEQSIQSKDTVAVKQLVDRFSALLRPSNTQKLQECFTATTKTLRASRNS